MKSEQLDQGTAAENCAESGLLRALLCTGLCGTGGRGGGSCSGVSLNLGKMCEPTRSVPQQSQCSHSWLSACSPWQLHSALEGHCLNISHIPSCVQSWNSWLGQLLVKNFTAHVLWRKD